MSKSFKPGGVKCKIEVIGLSFEEYFDQHYDFFFQREYF